MKITTWRITQKKHASNAFSGMGAWLEGARWNPKGTYMVYAAESIALAALELLVNLGRDDKLFGLYVRIRAEFDSKQVIALSEADLPSDWNSYPPMETTQNIGANWLKSNKSMVLKVPSVVIPEEDNYLINPLHEDFKSITIGNAKPFAFDPRLSKKSQRI